MEVEAAEKARMEKYSNMSAAKAEMLKNMDPSDPIEKLPDCMVKWNKILDMGRADPDWKYTDVEWNMAEKPELVLGEELFGLKENSGFNRFERCSNMPGWELFVDGASCRDIR